MTTLEFSNRVDGLINDFTQCLTSDREFRTGILDLLLAVAMPHLEKPKIDFASIASLDELRETLELIDDPTILTALRDEVRAYQKTGKPSVLKDEKYGFSLVYKAISNRANELTLILLDNKYVPFN